jgi:hypothetical protein
MGKIQEVYRLPLVRISEGARTRVSAVLSDLGLL